MRRTSPLVAVALIVFAADTAIAEKSESLRGYAEWRHGQTLVVDGQRVAVDRGTVLKGAARGGLASIELGWEVNVKGVRLPDGSLRAVQLEAKPNGLAFMEQDLVSASDEQEQQWLRDRRVTEEDDNGLTVVGNLIENGPDVDRVRRVLDRVAPPYVQPGFFRAYVVDSREWNAMAMPNGSVWVYRGLLDDMSDDELAVVMGHEVAHVTHEHARRDTKKGLWVQGLALGVMLAAESIDNGKARMAAQLGVLLGATAWQNQYSRASEDQADRVGLRYAYEGGYDVRQAPRMWDRFREKYGDDPRVLSFFFGSHPRESDRIARLQQQIAFNYEASAGGVPATWPGTR